MSSMEAYVCKSCENPMMIFKINNVLINNQKCPWCKIEINNQIVVKEEVNNDRDKEDVS